MSEINWATDAQNWRADWDDNGQWYIEPLGVTGRSLQGDSGDCIERERAHMLAAAPDLYRALQAVLSASGECDGREGDDVIDYIPESVAAQARAALAKARGEA